MFSLQQNLRIRGQNRFCLEWGYGEVGQTMYTHVSKCKNDKIKKKEYHKNNDMLTGEIMNVFLLRSGTKQGYLLSHYLCLIFYWQFLASSQSKKAREGNKTNLVWKERSRMP
jgi:hypothetical protein